MAVRQELDKTCDRGVCDGSLKGVCDGFENVCIVNTLLSDGVRKHMHWKRFAQTPLRTWGTSRKQKGDL